MQGWMKGIAAAPDAEPNPGARCPVSGVTPGRMVDVGWLVDSEKSGFVYPAPQSMKGLSAKGRGQAGSHAKAVGNCPAVLDYDARAFVVACPFDLHLRLGKDEKTGRPILVNLAGDESGITKDKVRQNVHLMGPDRWRHPKRPVLQIGAPYRFVTDEEVWITQTGPIEQYRDPPWPGVMIGGRFPLYLWPRTLMWAFEWWDPRRELILRRGEPWFTARFESHDPSRPIRLVQAEFTQELRDYCRNLDGVTNYVNQTYSLFEIARERRPEKLLTPKKVAKPAPSPNAAPQTAGPVEDKRASA